MKLKGLIKYRDIWMSIAIIWIVFFHSGIWPASEIMTDIKMIGYGGVDIFMFASGIGCFYSLERNSDSLNFIKRRVVRIIPTYWIFLIVWTIYNCIYNNVSWNSILGNFLCVRNFTGLGGEFNWYISAMWLMYLLAPFLKKIVDKIDSVYRFCWTIAIIGLFTICFWESFTYVITVSRLPVFFVGMCVGKMARDDVDIHKMYVMALLLLMILGFGALNFFQEYYSDYMWSRAYYWYPFIIIVPGLCWLISCLMVIVEKFLGNWVGELFSIPGKFSFEIYLLHIWFFDILNSNLIANNMVENKRSTWIVTILLLIPACFILKLSASKLARFIHWQKE